MFKEQTVLVKKGKKCIITLLPTWSELPGLEFPCISICSFIKAISSSVRARSSEPLMAAEFLVFLALLLMTTLLLPLPRLMMLWSFGSGWIFLRRENNVRFKFGIQMVKRCLINGPVFKCHLKTGQDLVSYSTGGLNIPDYHLNTWQVKADSDTSATNSSIKNYDKSWMT